MKTANCADCGKAITAKTKTGRCRSCKNHFLNSQPAFVAARAEGIRKKWSEDKAFAAKMRLIFSATGRANGTDPKRRAKLAELGKCKIAQLHSPESRAKAKAKSKQTGRKISEHYMGWCPPEYRDEYRRLTISKNLRANEARAIILAQIKADKARLSPFERQRLALEKGAQLVANDTGASLSNPADYGEAKWERLVG